MSMISNYLAIDVRKNDGISTINAKFLPIWNKKSYFFISSFIFDIRYFFHVQKKEMTLVVVKYDPIMTELNRVNTAFQNGKAVFN